MSMYWSEWLNLILGGGFVALLTGLITIRSTAAKGRAEAAKAKADADTVQITNTDSATRILIENIVKPLKLELEAVRKELSDTKTELVITRDELSENRREMSSTKREMVRLRKAVNDANACKHADDCPVLHRLRESSRNDSERADGYDTEEGQHSQDSDDQSRGGSAVDGDDVS